MKNNVGMYDRVIRVWIGIMAMLFAYFSPNIPYSWLGWFGIIPFVTGISGWCLVYSLFGTSTVKNEKT